MSIHLEFILEYFGNPTSNLLFPQPASFKLHPSYGRYILRLEPVMLPLYQHILPWLVNSSFHSDSFRTYLNVGVPSNHRALPLYDPSIS